MYRLFIDEIINNKKMYSLSLLYLSVLILTVTLLYDSFLNEFYDNIYSLIILLIYSSAFPMLICYKSEKLMLMNAKLPILLSGIYFTRTIKIMLIPVIGVILLLITNIFDDNAFSVFTIIGNLTFTILNFSVIIYQDMKVVTEKYSVIKRYSLMFIPHFILMIIFGFLIYLIKTNHLLHDNLGFRILSIVLFYAVCIIFSYQIFKLRKSYKS